MDIKKLLSRSTKKVNKGLKGKDGDQLKLPSAGTSANPQLYHDAIPESRGKKRKRGDGKVEEGAQGQEEEVFDFFAPKSTKTKAKGDEDAAAEKKQVQTLPPAELLDEEECRQILRSHRLKLHLLPIPKPEKKAKKSKKSKSSSKPEKLKPRELYPQPLQSFSDLRTTYGISKRLAENLADQGYKIPTEVQMGSLPLLLKPEIALGDASQDIGEGGINLLAVAPTGSGKTLAFLIPVVNGIIQRRRVSEEKKHELEAVIVVPTKELAGQIVNEAKKLCGGTGIKVMGMRRGMVVAAKDETEVQDVSSEEEEEEDDESEEKKKTNQPMVKGDILITTPGLLSSSLSTTSATLPTVLTLILDEADILLDPLFRSQTLAIWSSLTSPSLTTTLCSATVASNIETLALTHIRSRAQRLSLPQPPIIRLIVGLKDSALPTISHKLTYTATEPGKLLALRQLLHPSSSTSTQGQGLRPPFLIFVQTIPRAIALHSELKYDIPPSAGGSSRLAILHADLSDTARETVMNRFRTGDIWVLITTDILSRGVDFRGINAVVNYDVPGSGQVYVHRVGRTGRAGREGGVAVTFYTKDDIPYVRDVVNVIAASQKAAGIKEGGMLPDWVLKSLPRPSKDTKQKVKKFGVEARRGGLEDLRGKGGKISTKSGYERKLENRRRGAIEGSKRRAKLDIKGGAVEASGGESEGEGEGEWGGIE
jgi:ATP-dependent RNA helicase DDX52/ROK1